MMNFYRNMSLNKFETAFFDLLETGMIPSGSGINYDYEINESKDYFLVKNKYDIMDEYGSYIGTIPFTIYINKIDGTMKNIYFNNLNSHGRYLTIKYDIKNYLIDIYQSVF